MFCSYIILIKEEKIFLKKLINDVFKDEKECDIFELNTYALSYTSKEKDMRLTLDGFVIC